MKYRYVQSDSYNPYWNLAYEQSLFLMAGPDTVVLFLWQNNHTIVAGRNQDIYSECRVEEFEANGGTIARRKSGGGAVYHDLGNLNFSIICRETSAGENRYQDLLIRVLRRFSFQAEFNGRNDLLLNGAKFSGNAVWRSGGVVCQHGTVLISCDIGKMEYYLTPDKDKLNRNHVKSVSSRVVNLGGLNSRVSVDSIRQAMIEETAAKKMDGFPKERDVEQAVRFFRRQEWIYGGKR